MKKMYLSPDKKFLGVCAGVADYFNVDPNLVRIIVTMVVLSTAVIPGLIAYFVFSLVLPQPLSDYHATNANTGKKLYRSVDKKISGVCGGYAAYFELDPTIVRLIFALAFLFFGYGLMFYIVSAVFMTKPGYTNNG